MVQLVPVALVSVALAAQSSDPRTVLQEAAAAMLGVQSASYEGRLEVTAAASQRVVTGRVTMERSSRVAAGFLGGKVAVRGEVAGGSPTPEKFELTFDGKTVTRFQAATKSLLQADPGHGGEALVQGSYGGLILRELLAAEPFAEAAVAEATHAGASALEGRPVEVVELRPADGGSVSRWYIDVVDRLPRRLERIIRSSSGRDVQWVLTLADLQTGIAVDPAAFTINAPGAGTKVQVMGQNLPKTINIGDEAPDWTLKDGDGHERKLSEYRGQLVVLDFWATTCPHCRNAMPSMQKLHERYGARGVTVLGVNTREKPLVDAVAYVREKGFNYTVLVDASGEVAAKYRVTGIPAFFVVGPDGKIVYKDTGFNAAKETALVGIIERHLAGS